MSNFGEPWHIGYQLDSHEPPRWAEICDAKNLSVITPRSESEADRLLPTLARMIACVNACARFTDEQLQRVELGGAGLGFCSWDDHLLTLDHCRDSIEIPTYNASLPMPTCCEAVVHNARVSFDDPDQKFVITRQEVPE